MTEFFTTDQLVKLGRLPSKAMVAYLCRTGLLRPSLSPERRRGLRLRFSFQDVLFARTLAKLLETGVSVKRVRSALVNLRRELPDDPARLKCIRHIVIAGNRVLLQPSPHQLIDLAAKGQLVFHFMLDPIDLPAPAGKVRSRRASR